MLDLFIVNYFKLSNERRVQVLFNRPHPFPFRVNCTDIPVHAHDVPINIDLIHVDSTSDDILSNIFVAIHDVFYIPIYAFDYAYDVIVDDIHIRAPIKYDVIFVYFDVVFDVAYDDIDANDVLNDILVYADVFTMLVMCFLFY